MAKDTPKGELLAYIATPNLMVLVPKQRGAGYQKAPLGHHMNPLAKLSMDKGWDMTGLDGHLNIEVPPCYGAKERAATLEVYMPALAKFYGLPWREVDEREFWSLHPTTQKDASGATQ